MIMKRRDYMGIFLLLKYKVINNYSQNDEDDFIIKWMKPYADKY